MSPRRERVAVRLSTRTLVWGRICERLEPSIAQGRVGGVPINPLGG